MPPSTVVRLPSVPSLSWDDCRLLVESVVDYAIFMLDTDGRVATWNLGAEKIKGYQASEIIGEYFGKFFPAEDVAAGKPERELERAREAGRAEDEGWRVRKDGSLFWASVTITALRDPSGALRGYGKVTRDLTARRGAEQALRLSEERFHQLVDAVVDYAIFLLDPTGAVATWNVGARRLKGYEPAEIIGKHFSTFYPPEDRAAGTPETILETVRQTGRFESEGWRVRKDGSRFWANVVITSLRDDSGKLLGFAKVTRDLSDRQRTLEALRSSEERFRLLVESVGDYAIYMLDVDGRVTTWNLGAERMKGYSAQEIIGQNFATFFPESDIAEGKPARELAVARESGRFEDEGWRIRKDGSRFWANAVVTAAYDPLGKLVGFAKVTRDLTARREAEETTRRLIAEQAARKAAQAAEEELRASEERLRSLSRRLEIVLDGMADGMTVQDRSGRIVLANSAAAAIFGVDSAQVLIDGSRNVFDHFEVLDENGRALPPEELPSSRVFVGERASAANVHLRRRGSGQEAWFALRATAVLDSDGAAELAISIWHDVTERHRRERQAKYLAEASTALSTSLVDDAKLSRLAHLLVPSLGDWCTIFLLQGEYLREAATTHHEVGRAALAAAYRQRYPLDEAHVAGVWQVIRGGRSHTLNGLTDAMLGQLATDPDALASLKAIGIRSAVIVPILARDRVLGAMTVVTAESDRHYEPSDVALLEELGRRTGVALENAQLYAAARHAAEVADAASRAKDEFLATVSHELRTPLTAILGWSRLLKDRATDAALLKPIDVIHRNAEAQVKIIDDILDVSRVITGKFKLELKAADLVSITREAIDVVRPSAVAKKISIEFTASGESCLLVADPERLRQAVWNLLSNAVKFTEPKGAIHVGLEQVNSTAVLSVADTGGGIDPEFLPFVFDRFRQADSSTTRRVGGLGLGLALVRHIVELHGGTVSVTSEGLGKGSTFAIRLPIRAVAPAGTDTPAPPSVVPSQGRLLSGIRVLVVDDEPDARELLTEVLRQHGGIVESAASAEAGFQAFQRFRPDVLVSDIGMPNEDGLSFMRRVRSQLPTEGGAVPSLALSAFAREEDLRRALAAGYTLHMGKPVDPGALATAVAGLADPNLASYKV
jgi:PAS domain S-box-containing protein